MRANLWCAYINPTKIYDPIIAVRRHTRTDARFRQHNAYKPPAVQRSHPHKNALQWDAPATISGPLDLPSQAKAANARCSYIGWNIRVSLHPGYERISNSSAFSFLQLYGLELHFVQHVASVGWRVKGCKTGISRQLDVHRADGSTKAIRSVCAHLAACGPLCRL